jgi:hypothetical protein
VVVVVIGVVLDVHFVLKKKELEVGDELEDDEMRQVVNLYVVLEESVFQDVLYSPLGNEEKQVIEGQREVFQQIYDFVRVEILSLGLQVQRKI